MKTLSYHHFIFLLAGLLFASAVNAQTAYMHGSTYEERGHSLIDQMLQTQPVDNGNIKYVSPFYFYNPQIEMFARFKMKSSFHKTKRII